MRSLWFSAVFVIFAMMALGVALAFRSADQRDLEKGRYENCQAIEVLKAQLRPELFDLANTKRILHDLNIDPGSETGKRLIQTSRENNAEERARLAPREC